MARTPQVVDRDVLRLRNWARSANANERRPEIQADVDDEVQIDLHIKPPARHRMHVRSPVGKRMGCRECRAEIWRMEPTSLSRMG